MINSKIIFLMLVVLIPFIGSASEKKNASVKVEDAKIIAESPTKSSILAIDKEENFLGNGNAKLTIIEYSSLECGHCANFHNDAFKKIKSEYIDKGLVKYVVRDFPLSKIGMAGAKLAHCAPKEKYFDLMNTLFETQSIWAFNSKYLEALLNISKLGGISEEKFKECQDNEELQVFILKRAMNASQVLNIKSTPTFFIGEEELAGEVPYAKFKQLIDNQLQNHSN